MGEAALALAEEAILTGDFRNAVQQATRATQLLPRGSASWLRAEDIRSEVKVERGNRS
jgi:predicted Zn-dependent protease